MNQKREKTANKSNWDKYKKKGTQENKVRTTLRLLVSVVVDDDYDEAIDPSPDPVSQ